MISISYRYDIKDKHLTINKKWVIEQIQKNKLTMIDCTFTTLNNGFFAFTSEGYIIKVTANSIYKNQSNPVFSNKNPYVIYNIKRFLFLSDIKTVLLSTEYICNTGYLNWKCECGNCFEVPWNRFLQGQQTCKKCSRKSIFVIPVDKLKSDFAEYGYKLITNVPKAKNESVEYI